MDKHLKNLNFDDKIQTVFSNEGRQNVMKKINKLDRKPRIRFYMPMIVSTLVVSGAIYLGVLFIWNEVDGPRETYTVSHSSNSNNSKDPEEIISGVMDEFSKDQLKVDAYVDRQDSTYNPYNYSLYMAHLNSAVITGNYFYHSMLDQGPPNTKEEIQLYLESILKHLNTIIYEEESEGRIKEAIKLTKQVMEMDAEPSDPIYDEIHDILHELDEYYNMNPFIDEITSEHGYEVPEKIRAFEAEARESNK